MLPMRRRAASALLLPLLLLGAGAARGEEVAPASCPAKLGAAGPPAPQPQRWCSPG